MDFWQGFAVITVVHLLAAASPGPDFAYVTRQSLVHGRRAGLLASVGIALGLAIHIVYSAAGLAAVVAHSAHWMTAIKLAGGAYLLYLGIRGLRSRAGAPAAAAAARCAAPTPLRQVLGGFLCNALNPKAPIYFLALFTVVLVARTAVADAAGLRRVDHGAAVVVVLAGGDCCSRIALVRDRLLAVRHWIDRAFGVAMVALGIRVLATVRD